MRKLYALFVLAALTSFGLSTAQAQSYDASSYLVRAITNDFQDIQGQGEDITSELAMIYTWEPYYKISSEKTIPFNFRLGNLVSNKMRITGNGAVIMGGYANVPEMINQLYANYYYYYWYYIPYGYGSTYGYGANSQMSAWAGYWATTSELTINWAVLGTAPNRRVVVQTTKMSNPYYPATRGSYQVVMYESGISRFEFHFRDDNPGQNWYNYGYQGPFTGFTTNNDGSNWSTYVGVRGPNTARYWQPDYIPPVGGTPNVYSPPSYSNVSPVYMPTVGYRVFIAYPYDLAVSGITNPLNEQILNRDVAFTPRGVISNEGTAVPGNVLIRRKIAIAGGVVPDWVSDMTISAPAAFSSTSVTFPSFTPTAYGIYYDTMWVVSMTPADQNTANNMVAIQYTVSPPNNMKALAVTNPAPGSRTPINIPTPVGAQFKNLGANNQINVPVSMVIRDPSGQIIYRDTVRFPRINSTEVRDTNFRDWTPTINGEHSFEAIAILGNDQLRLDDTARGKARVAYEADAAAIAVISPEIDQEMPEKRVFKIFGHFQAVGVRPLFDVPVRLQLRRCSDGALVFQADSTIPELNTDAGNVSFGFPTKQGTQYDVTKLAPGCYTACIIARQGDDGDRTNDTSCSQFTVISRLSGNIEVGKGRRFPSIHAAVDSMRFRGIGGHLNLIMTDSYYRENHNNSASSQQAVIDFSRIEGLGENARVTWKPKAGISPRVAVYGNAPFGFYWGPEGAAYMTWDGMNQIAPTPEKLGFDVSKRGMTLVDSLSANGALIGVEYGYAHHLTFKNLKLQGRGGYASDSSAVIRMYNVRDNFTFGALRMMDTTEVNNITIENNEIGGARYGIWSQGSRPLFDVGPANFRDRRNYNNRIVRNQITNVASAGIAFDHEENLLIERNEIWNVRASLTGLANTAAAGIAQLGTGNAVNVVVNANRIHNVSSTGTGMTGGISFAQSGIIYTQGNGPLQKRSVLPVTTANRVANNMVYDLRGTSVVPVSYYTLASNYFTSNDSVYHNSLSTQGAMYNVYMAQSSKPFVMNNVIQNTNVTGTAVANYYFEVPRPFAENLRTDYNLFDLRNLNRFATVVERDRTSGTTIQTRHFRRLNDWRTFTQQDVHSVLGDPRFTSDSLHLPGSLSYIASPASSNGIWLRGGLQSRDFDGDLRQSGDMIDIGADAFDGFELTNDLAVMAIYKPSGYSSTSDITFVSTENPLQIQAVVKNLSQGALYNRTVDARLEVSMSGGPYQTIWNGSRTIATFDVNESEIVDFTGPMITEQQERNGTFRVVVTVGNDQNNANNMQEKLFTVMIKRNATVISYDGTSARGMANKDSVAGALRRLGVAYDSLNRANFAATDIDYTAWWTVIYSMGDAASSNTGGLTLKQTEELTRYLNAGETYAKKSLILAGQNIAFYNDFGMMNLNPVTDREFTRNYLHMQYVASTPTGTSYLDSIRGAQVYFQFQELLSSNSPDVVAKTVNTPPVGAEVAGLAYTYRNHASVPTDSAAGTTWAGKEYNVVFYAFDWADPRQSFPGEAGMLSSGVTRVTRGALDFIQSFRGTVLPVDFVEVTANDLASGNQISWKVADQKDVARFEVESFTGAGASAVWSKVGEVGATQYAFLDENVQDGKTYTYRVVAVDLDGSRKTSQTVNVSRATTNGFTLEQNYPNPFNPSTTIGFRLSESADVTISVLDVTGKVVAQVTSQSYEAGPHSLQFHASDLTSGTYVYEMTATLASGEVVKMSRKMTLNK